MLTCDSRFFGGLEGAIHSLDTYWSDHQIVFYDLGLKKEQKQLVKKTKISSYSQISFHLFS